MDLMLIKIGYRDASLGVMHGGVHNTIVFPSGQEGEHWGGDNISD